MIDLLSKREGTTFSAAPAPEGATQFPLTTCCPVLCRGRFDGSSGATLSAFRRVDLVVFQRELKSLYVNPIEGRSETLWSVDGGAVLTVRFTPHGQVIGEFVLSPLPHEGRRLHGHVEIDLTYIPTLVAQCDALLGANYVSD